MSRATAPLFCPGITGDEALGALAWARLGSARRPRPTATDRGPCIRVPRSAPSPNFVDCLSRRVFPTTIRIRDGASLDYLPEPDLFHDIAGHVWFTVECGLMRGATRDDITGYGSGLLSSDGEIVQSVMSPTAQRQSWQLGRNSSCR
jgi:hypothetical protein